MLKAIGILLFVLNLTQAHAGSFEYSVATVPPTTPSTTTTTTTTTKPTTTTTTTTTPKPTTTTTTTPKPTTTTTTTTTTTPKPTTTTTTTPKPTTTTTPKPTTTTTTTTTPTPKPTTTTTTTTTPKPTTTTTTTKPPPTNTSAIPPRIAFEKEVQNVIKFAVSINNNASRSSYNIQAEKIIYPACYTMAMPNDKTFYTVWNVEFRTSQSYCKRDDEACKLQLEKIPYDDNEEPMPLHHQGRYYVPFIAPIDEAILKALVEKYPTNEVQKVIRVEATTMAYPAKMKMCIRSLTTPKYYFLPLCISVKYTSEKTNITFNHFALEKWGQEETYSMSEPLELNRKFSIEISKFQNDYQIQINNELFNYSVQTPSRGATYVEITGLVTLDNVIGIEEIEQRGIIRNPQVPVLPLVLPIHDLPLRDNINRIISVGGFVNSNPENFEIRLQNTNSVTNYTYALSLNFTKQGLEIQNRINGTWQLELKRQDIDFRRGLPFYLEFAFTPEDIMLVFHGEKIVHCPYKNPPAVYTHLVVDGQINVNRITGLNSIEHCQARVWQFKPVEFLLRNLTCFPTLSYSYARYGNIPKVKAIQPTMEIYQLRRGLGLLRLLGKSTKLLGLFGRKVAPKLGKSRNWGNDPSDYDQRE